MQVFIADIGWLLVIYLVGSLPFGLIVSKMAKGLDPRLLGSKNIGATNVARICGSSYGILTFLLDMAKGFIPVVLVCSFSESAFFITLTALAALLGHMYSVILDGKGGKGISTTIGIFLALAWGPLFWSLVIFLILIWVTGYIAAGSLGMVTVLPIFMLLSGHFSYLILSLIVLLLVYSKHRDNIIRLAKGEEHPWRKSKFSSKWA